MSLLYLLARNAHRLPDARMSACTVLGLSKQHDISVAQEACRALEIPHAIVSAEDVTGLLRLRVSIDSALEAILSRHGRPSAINAVHAIMRSGVEYHARSIQADAILFGLHQEDLMASLLRSLTSGIPFGESPYRKGWGRFSFAYPLWPITKKELTLYLMAIAPASHAAQGSPTPYDRGGIDRDLHYFIADHLNSLWPGFAHHAFSGAAELNRETRSAPAHNACSLCGTYYQVSQARPAARICQLCETLASLDLTETTR